MPIFIPTLGDDKKLLLRIMNKKYYKIGIPLAIVAIVVLCTLLFRNKIPLTGLTDSTSSDIDYNFHIRPLLSDRCFKCHGPDANQRKAGLRLDTKEGAFAALKESPGLFAIVPGKPEESELLKRICTQDTAELMPPPSSHLSLNKDEIALIEKWIRQGAAYKPHWAFIPPVSSELPKVRDKRWPRNEMDYFILSSIEKNGLKPNKEADKERLLKRLSFDLTGLPPSIEIQDRFLQDPSSNAYEKIVDELLASPHYGEKMALHWLDIARYADSHGYQDDGYRSMWPWRDWVIHAFNENYPYDKFATWQLAGDLLPNPSKEQLLATGFNRNHKITQEGGVIDEEYRVEYVSDRTNTFGKAFLGLTYECAKCHDHKYDPISAKDYYGTFAFFNQVPEKGIYGTIDASFADPPNMKIRSEDVSKVLNFINKVDTEHVMVMIMQDSSKRRPTYILERGAYDAYGEQVFVQSPKDILPFDTTLYPSNRLGLAQWLFSKDHPLTSRVFVNRIWQEFYGRGLVKTTGDFGMQGELPSHPELLDWMAIDFQENGWDIKRLVKQIVMSATYRQSAEIPAEKLEKDPENILLARAPRIRLTAELVRDHVLASSGLLNHEIGGPSIKPYQPRGLWEVSTSGRGTLSRYVQDKGEQLYRRGMYVFIKRTVPPPSMLIFDASNRDQCEVKRSRTNTPLQALVMLNDPHVIEASKVLASNLLLEEGTLEDKIDKCFRMITCRKPRPNEVKIMAEYYAEEKALFEKQPEKATPLLQIGEAPIEAKQSVELAAMMQLVQMIYNLDESISKT